MELLCGGLHSVLVGGVDDEDDGGGVCVVAAPVRPDAGLAAEVPDVKLEVLVAERLDVEADGGLGGDDLADLQPVQDGGLAGTVEAEDQYAELPVGAPEAVEHRAEVVAHGARVCARSEATSTGCVCVCTCV